MVNTGTKEASCIFAGNKQITRIMTNNNKIYPSFDTDWLTFPRIRSLSRYVTITFKVNQNRGTGWKASDFLAGTINNSAWHMEFISNFVTIIYRFTSGLSSIKLIQNCSYITGIHISKVAISIDFTDFAKLLPNLREIRIATSVRNLGEMSGFAPRTPRLKYIFCSLNSFREDRTGVNYFLPHSGIQYLQAMNTSKGRSSVFTDTGNLKRPTPAEIKWLEYSWGSRYRMIGLEESIACSNITNRSSANHKFKQFMFRPVVLDTTDLADSQYTAFSGLGLFDENGIEFSTGAGNVFNSVPYFGNALFPFDGDWDTTWHSKKGIAYTFLGKKFPTAHRLDCVRLKGRGAEASRGPLIFWILGRNENTDPWQIVMVCDKIPYYSSTWSNNEQCAWYPEHSRRIFEKCETSADGSKIIFGGISGRTFFLHKPGTAANYFSIFVNGQKINVTSDLTNQQSNILDLGFTVSPPIEKGQTIELSYDEPPTSVEYLSVKDSRHATSSDPDFNIRFPSIVLMSVDNKSTIV